MSINELAYYRECVIHGTVSTVWQDSVDAFDSTPKSICDSNLEFVPMVLPYHASQFD